MELNIEGDHSQRARVIYMRISAAESGELKPKAES